MAFGRAVATAVLRRVPRGPGPGPLALVYPPAIEANAVRFRLRKDKNVLPFGKDPFGSDAVSVMGGVPQGVRGGPGAISEDVLAQAPQLSAKWGVALFLVSSGGSSCMVSPW